MLVVVPAAVAAWVLYRLFYWVDTLLWEDIRFGWVRPGGIPGVGIIAVTLAVLLIGLLVNNYLGRRLYSVYDRFLTRIPLFNKIYTALKQIGEALFASERTVFRAVGMIEYPRRGLWSLVFITESPNEEMHAIAGERLRSVFLPTTPNPTSGFLLMVPEKDLTALAISVEEGLKMVISGGAIVPGEAGGMAPVLRPRRRRRGWLARLFGGGDESAVIEIEDPQGDAGPPESRTDKAAPGSPRAEPPGRETP